MPLLRSFAARLAMWLSTFAFLTEVFTGELRKQRHGRGHVYSTRASNSIQLHRSGMLICVKWLIRTPKFICTLSSPSPVVPA
jgi:hypothetical protein